MNACEKLFFILFYFKCYPTFDLLGFLFDMHRANGCRNVYKLLPIIEEVLKGEMVLPKRKIHTVEELFEICPEAEDSILGKRKGTVKRTQLSQITKDRYSILAQQWKERNMITTHLRRSSRKLLHHLSC